MRDAVSVNESQSPIQPFPAPPLPSEALALTRSGQMTPNLLLYPVSDVAALPPISVSDGPRFQTSTMKNAPGRRYEVGV
jgi:hypothetical protein